MKIFRFIKHKFISTMFFSYYLPCANSLSCISMNNQPRKTRPEIINISTKNPIFYPFSVKTRKCSGNCNNIDDPYKRICVLDVVKDLNFKVFNLMS